MWFAVSSLVTPGLTRDHPSWAARAVKAGGPRLGAGVTGCADGWGGLWGGMSLQSLHAKYALFRVLTAFAMLPFGVRTHEEVGAPRVPGQADSAPHQFRPGQVALRATVLSALLFGLWVLNYRMGWVTRETFDFLKNVG